MELNEFDIWLCSDDGTLKKDMYMSLFYELVHKAAAKTGALTLLSNQDVAANASWKGACSRFRGKHDSFSRKPGSRISKI